MLLHRYKPIQLTYPSFFKHIAAKSTTATVSTNRKKQTVGATMALWILKTPHRLPPEDGSVLGDPLVVLVGQDHRQVEGALLCVRAHIVLMDCGERNTKDLIRLHPGYIPLTG